MQLAILPEVSHDFPQSLRENVNLAPRWDHDRPLSDPFPFQQSSHHPMQCSVDTCRVVKAAPYLRRLVAGFPPRRPGFDPRSNHVRFVVNKVALEQVFFQYLGFTCWFSFHRLLHTHHLLSGAGTIGQLVADVPSEFSLTLPEETKKAKKKL
jgi:hypothetical protein